MNKPNNGESVLAFICWITTRDGVISAGGNENCSPWAAAFKEFSEHNNLDQISKEWPNVFEMPLAKKET